MDEATTHQTCLIGRRPLALQAVGANSAAVLGASQNFVCGWKGADLAGECGLAEKGEHIDHARYLNWLRLGLSFLRFNFPVSAGCRLGLTWFHQSGHFPTIALVWDEDVPAGATEAAYAMERAINQFNRTVNWRALSDLLDAQK